MKEMIDIVHNVDMLVKKTKAYEKTDRGESKQWRNIV